MIRSCEAAENQYPANKDPRERKAAQDALRLEARGANTSTEVDFRLARVLAFAELASAPEQKRRVLQVGHRELEFWQANSRAGVDPKLST